MKEKEKTIEAIKELLFLPREELVRIVYQAVSDKMQLEDKLNKIQEYINNHIIPTESEDIILQIIIGGNYK